MGLGDATWSSNARFQKARSEECWNPCSRGKSPFFLMSWITMFPICFVSPGFLGLHSDDGYIDVFMLFFSVSKCPLLIFQGWIPMCLYIHCPLSMSKCGSD